MLSRISPDRAVTPDMAPDIACNKGKLRTNCIGPKIAVYFSIRVGIGYKVVEIIGGRNR